ncbi:MAG TPA: ATP-binding protein [Thermoflexales bacterium]|nr:ATP-binding protein [Thermoflexales bacterium]HQW35143.1 ATP-binding protein [Thermoflexales bacterium]
MNRKLIFVLAFAAVLAMAIGLVELILHPVAEDMPTFALLMSIPLLVAVGAAFITQRWGWYRQFRSLGYALFAAYAIGAGIILLTVLVTTRLMFISLHDATLAVVLVIYATLLTLTFGYFVAQNLSAGIKSITDAARKVQDGDLSATAPYTGRDEIARLAQAFNSMTGRLRHARDQEKKLDQARRDLIAWVSHDLRTPLTGIRARAEALSDGVVSDPREVSSYLTAIHRDTEAMNRLIDDLFEMATIDSGGLKLNLVDVALSDLISDTIESAEILAKQQGVALSGSVAGNVDPVHLSPEHIQRVLNNLVSNALAHTPAGGRVTVKATRQGERVRVSVQDTGEGIRAEDLPRVFERFYRGQSSRTRHEQNGNARGMGLGLVIARAIIEEHGGHIEIESEESRGTTVWFTV